ncbi:putative protein kinase [Leptomonas pyrrhocoris]|uniref:Protein kinase domain-containing protein n=1 Tax=Leptomonas pyrrhocoris TaxID=157538 RepID=A0A0N0VFJ1_LEPPY|nr:putative protein kinase [Leptomonas pyrrhocoris]KPA80801.1 putative protein kinase [Leptomonas pyrrhocoris]|eukprot:XP_015659240.1 putative protein kinase [Leptomonas pyrrhocoris]
MSTRSYYKGGGGASAVAPPGIQITTSAAADNPASAFTDALKQQQQQQQQMQQMQENSLRSLSPNDKKHLSSPTGAAAAAAAAVVSPNSNSRNDAGAVIRAISISSVASAPAAPAQPLSGPSHMIDPNGVDADDDHLLRNGNSHPRASAARNDAGDVDDDVDDFGGADSGMGNSANEPLDYCGVRLLPGVEQLDFDEGYYVGTVDENGEMAGYGKATWHTGDTYEGEWLDGMMHGKGAYTWADGDYYKGEYAKGRMEGYGEMKDTTGLYTGEWVADMRQGYGRMVYAGGNIYEGEWLAGMRHGPGKLIEVAANVVYQGEFNRNEKEGRGVQTNDDGDVYEGEFANGKPNGRGTYMWSDGSRYIGMFKDGVKHGDGCEWLANGDWIAGMFCNGEHVDDNSTRHKAIQLSGVDDDDAADAVDDDEGRGGAGGESGAAVDANGNPIPAKHAVIPGLTDEAAAAVLKPLDSEQLRRITEPAAQASMDFSHRNSIVPANVTDGASPTAHNTSRNKNNSTYTNMASSGSIHGATAGSDSLMSPLTLALNAPQVLLEDSELEGWTPLKTIGKGSFGAVYTALLRNGRTVCCKVIELGNVESEEEMEKLRNEIALMKRLHHPNCVQYYGSLEDRTKNTLNIFMEYVSGGTLTSFVNKFKSIPLETMRQWAYQMATGVKYLHDCGIVHRDIKGDNVLVSVDGIVKLADFGCSKSIDDVCSATHGCSTMVGTPYWMAPEVIKCEAGGYGMKSDIWSLGCTIVEMLTGKPPWPECNSMWAAVYKIANSTGLPTEIPSDVDAELMDLLEKCFERNPKLRLTATALLQHPFFAKVTECGSSRRDSITDAPQR